MKIYIILLTCSLVFVLHGEELEQNFAHMLTEVDKFGSYTDKAYDKEKACSLLVDFIKKHNDKLKPEYKFEIYYQLAGLNSMWAPSKYRDNAAAKEYYKKSIDVMEDKVSYKLVSSKVNYACSSDDINIRVKNTIELCTWLTYIRFMDDDELASRMVYQIPARGLTELNKKAQIRQLKSFIDSQIKINSDTAVSLAKRDVKNRELLELLSKTFKIGVLAERALVEFPEEEKVEGAKLELSAEDKAINDIAWKAQSIAVGWKTLNLEKLTTLFSILNDQRLIPKNPIASELRFNVTT